MGVILNYYFNVSLHHDNCGCCWQDYVHGHSFLNHASRLPEIKKKVLQSLTSRTSRDVSVFGTSFIIMYWTCYNRTPFVEFVQSTRIFYRGVPRFSTDRCCGVWCHGLITYLLYVSLLVGYLNKNWFVSLIWLQRFWHSFLIVLYIFIHTYRNILYYICALSFICLIFTSQIMLNFSHTVSANVVSTLFTYNQSSLLPPVQKLVSSVEICCIGSFFTVRIMDRLSIKKCWNQ